MALSLFKVEVLWYGDRDTTAQRFFLKEVSLYRRFIRPHYRYVLVGILVRSKEVCHRPTKIDKVHRFGHVVAKAGSDAFVLDIRHDVGRKRDNGYRW